MDIGRTELYRTPNLTESVSLLFFLLVPLGARHRHRDGAPSAKRRCASARRTRVPGSVRTSEVRCSTTRAATASAAMFTGHPHSRRRTTLCSRAATARTYCGNGCCRATRAADSAFPSSTLPTCRSTDSGLLAVRMYSLSAAPWCSAAIQDSVCRAVSAA